jgi:hypothetical protein
MFMSEHAKSSVGICSDMGMDILGELGCGVHDSGGYHIQCDFGRDGGLQSRACATAQVEEGGG